MFDLNTGLRQDELFLFEWYQAKLLRKTILITKTMNDKPKTVPLNKIALDVINNKVKGKEYQKQFCVL